MAIPRSPFWPKDYPASIPALWRWPQEMIWQYPWPAKYWSRQTAFFEGTPYTTHRDIVWSMDFYDGLGYYWIPDKEPLNPNLKTFLYVTIERDSFQRLSYEWKVFIAGVSSAIWDSTRDLKSAFGSGPRLGSGQQSQPFITIFNRLNPAIELQMDFAAVAGWFDRDKDIP